MSTDVMVYKVGKLLEASNVTKSMLVPYILLFMFIQYLVFMLFFIVNPSPYVDNTIVSIALVFVLAVLVISSVIIAFRHRLEQSATAQHYMPYFAGILYVNCLMVMGYLIGLLSFPAGLVVAGAPLLAIILFDGKVVISIIAAGTVWLIGLSVATVLGWLPYAPVYTAGVVDSMQYKTFMHVCMLLFMLPYLFMFYITMHFLTKYWQSREEDIKRMSLTDGLIGMANRRAIFNHLEYVRHKHQSAISTSIILVDVDFFKKINDNFGHVAGDMVLCRVGESLKSNIRRDDQIGRYGGEEFLIVLPNTSLTTALDIAERCRRELQAEVIWSDDGRRINVTASFGVHTSNDASEAINSLIQKVDVQLYRAKECGRNQVCAEALA